MEKAGQKNILNLLRCAWAGSQKYGALVWSGDIHSSFESFRNQFAAGLHMGIAGIPWWTTDIGGFHGGNPSDEAFREVFARWFQYGTFCPVMRLHGDREPHTPPMSTVGGGRMTSGGPNEVWSYGETLYEMCRKYMFLRERLRPYITGLMQDAHEKGTPVIRPMFYDFPRTKLLDARRPVHVRRQPARRAGHGGRAAHEPSICPRARGTTRGPARRSRAAGRLRADAPLTVIPVYERRRPASGPSRADARWRALRSARPPAGR